MEILEEQIDDCQEADNRALEEAQVHGDLEGNRLKIANTNYSIGVEI